jgi:hypothetical protein
MSPSDPAINGGNLLDPAYHELLDESPQSWSHETLPAIRQRVHAGFQPAEPLRFQEHWVASPEGKAVTS